MNDDNCNQPDTASPMVHLAPELTSISMPYHDRVQALASAYRITLSPHEHTWTQEEQAQMAQYCLWAHQRLCVIESIAMGTALAHAP